MEYQCLTCKEIISVDSPDVNMDVVCPHCQSNYFLMPYVRPFKMSSIRPITWKYGIACAILTVYVVLKMYHPHYSELPILLLPVVLFIMILDAIPYIKKTKFELFSSLPRYSPTHNCPVCGNIINVSNYRNGKKTTCSLCGEKLHYYAIPIQQYKRGYINKLMYFCLWVLVFLVMSILTKMFNLFNMFSILRYSTFIYIIWPSISISYGIYFRYLNEHKYTLQKFVADSKEDSFE